MQNQGGNYVRATMVFAELELAGTRVECPRCHVPFNPHLGNLLAAKFHCVSCKATLSYRNTSGVRTVMCPCCNMWRDPPSRVATLACGGCDVTIIYKRGDRTVKCSVCKHINNPQPEANVPAHPAEWVYVPQSFWAGPQEVEIESTASSSISPQPPSPNTSVDESVQERTRQILRDTVLRIRREREVERYQREKAEGKKIRRL